MFDAMIEEADSVVRGGAPDALLTCRRTAFMRYHGQGHEIEIPLPDRALTLRDVGPLREAFEDEYRKQFARAVPGMTIEVLNWSVRIASATNHPRNETAKKDATGSVEPLRQTSIRCDVSGQTRQADIYARARLRPGQEVRGPALIIEPQTTTYVSADFAAEVAGDGTLILTRTEEAK